MKLLPYLLFLLLLGGITSTSASAQTTAREDSLLLSVDFTDNSWDARHPRFLFADKGFLVRYNPVSLVFGGMLYLYQKAISPQLQSSCPYERSCSAFSMASIEEFGLIKGVALTADRLGRCTQFTMVDLRPSQFNQDTKSIIDEPVKYRVRSHRHHDHHH